MMSRNEEAHAACLNILSDNKDSAPRIAELCTLSRLLGSELDTITAERDEWKRRCEQAESDSKQLGDRWHELRSQLDAIIAIAEGRDNG